MLLIIALTCSSYLISGRRLQAKQSNDFRSTVHDTLGFDTSDGLTIGGERNSLKGLAMLLSVKAPRLSKANRDRSASSVHRLYRSDGNIIRPGRSLVSSSTRPSLRLRRLRGGSSDTQVFVKTRSGKTMPVEVKDGDTIADVRARLHDKKGIPMEDQRIIFGSNESVVEAAKSKGAEQVLRPAPSPRNAERKMSSKRVFDPSVEELEETLKGAFRRARRCFRRLRRLFRRHRRLGMAIGGMLGLMHGGSVAYTILFVQSFERTGWPLVRSGLQRGLAAYEEAKALQLHETSRRAEQMEPAREELKQLALKLAKLRREGASESEQRVVIQDMRDLRQKFAAAPSRRRVFPILVAAFEPSVLRDVLVGTWSGVTASLATACSQSARIIGIGVTLGEFVSKASLVLLTKIDLAVRRAKSRLPPEAVMLTYLGPSLLGSAVLNLVGRTIGCWVAFRLQHFAAMMSVSLLSAHVFLESLELFLSGKDATPRSATNSSSEDLHYKQRRDIIAWVFALGSIQKQLSKDYKMPLSLKILLLPVLGVEALLHSLANRLTATRFPVMR